MVGNILGVHLSIYICLFESVFVHQWSQVAVVQEENIVNRNGWTPEDKRESFTRSLLAIIMLNIE